ncbi:MAG: hypothetical protein HZB26_26240 [Candidatus Hydrogenedentes bacterium]|nr:hypothetical protein [Candidatus Hydrogenedentota bacterium]
MTIATLLIVSQLQRSLALKLYRALPLSNMGCVLLIMSYPVVRISAVTPFMGAMLWFAGLEHILTFLLTWTFTTLGLAPLFLLLMVRNPVVGTLMSALLVAPGVLGLLLAADKGLLSPTVCWVDVLVCTTLGFGAFWGLYYTVKNSSTAYRQPFVR